MAYKTGWMKKIINGVSTKVFAFAHAKTVYTDYANGKTLDQHIATKEIQLLANPKADFYRYIVPVPGSNEIMTPPIVVDESNESFDEHEASSVSGVIHSYAWKSSTIMDILDLENPSGITKDGITVTYLESRGVSGKKLYSVKGTATSDTEIPLYSISNPKDAPLYFTSNRLSNKMSESTFYVKVSDTSGNLVIMGIDRKVSKKMTTHTGKVTVSLIVKSGTEIRNNFINIKCGYSKQTYINDYSSEKYSDTEDNVIDAILDLKNDPKFTNSISLGRKEGTVVGTYSSAEGGNTTASGGSSHAEGFNTSAEGSYSHAEGYTTIANGTHSHAEGNLTLASKPASHAEGIDTSAIGTASHAEGSETTALDYQHAGGHNNNTHTATASKSSGTGTGTSFVIGNGTSSSKSNAFRVDDNGTPYSKAGLNTTGADYAEFFEWEDGNENNEDRRGYFVTLDGKHIKIAKEGDWILGIVSGFPAIIGNGDEEWKGRYVFDDFGCPVIEEFEYEEEIPEVIINDEGEEEVITKKVKRTGTKWKEVPEYDPTQPYTGRMQRKEWSAIGMLGVLSVRDDGSCKVNGFCKLADGGIATDSDTGYRVVKRVTDNIVEVIFK